MLIKRAGARRNHVPRSVGFSFPYGRFPGRGAQTSPPQLGQLAVQGPPAQERPRAIQEVPFSGSVGKVSTADGASPAAPECDQPAAAPGGLRMAAGPGGAADAAGRPGAEGHRSIVPSAFQQSWDQKGYRASSWQSQPRQTKPWNKYYGKDAWGAGQTDRYDVKEATPAEITAANKRKSEGKSDVQGAEKTDPAADPDDAEYLRTLWTSAKEAAHGDPGRSKSAAELVAAGELRPWWTYSWKQVSEMFPQTSDYKECLQSACGDIPPLVVNRLATLLAAFRHYQRPLEGSSPLSESFGPEVVRFDIPGQHVVAATCHMPFPEYQESSEYAHFGTFSHGTSWTAGAGIAEHGGLTVGHSQADHFPCFGFSARGSLTAFSRESMISAVTKTATRSKSLGGIIVVTEATLPGPTPNIEGGGE